MSATTERSPCPTGTASRSSNPVSRTSGPSCRSPTGAISRPAVQRLRRLLDLDADPVAVDAVLGDDPRARAARRQDTGTAKPARSTRSRSQCAAIVGQQVSVAGARTVTARIVAAAGDVLTLAHDRLAHVFPAPARLAALDPRRCRCRGRAAAPSPGWPRPSPADRSCSTRAPTARRLVRRLVALPGIGQWTARYTVIRGLGDPDVFLDTDLGVRHTLERLGLGASDAERWRPWRTYAVHHLWATL